LLQVFYYLEVLNFGKENSVMAKTPKKNSANKTPPKKAMPTGRQVAVKPVKQGILLLILIGVIFCLYFPVLNYKFTNNDDTALIKDNYEFLTKPSNFGKLFTQSVFQNTFKSGDSYYRPILSLSYFIDTQIAGKHYWFFYLTDILLHIACCILLLLLLQKLSYDRMRSFFFTLIFAVHPVLVQSVAWLPGRNDTLLALFAILSLYFLISFHESKNKKFLLFHFVFFIIALFTKETAIFLPFLYLLYLIIYANANQKISIVKKISNVQFEIIGWLAVIIVFMIIRRNVLGDALGLPLSFTLTNFFNNLPAIIQYIGKIVIPVHLNTMPVLQDVPIFYGLLVLIAMAVLIWKTKNRNSKKIIFGFLWLLIFLMPAILRTSSYIETLFLEHRLYFPMIGFIIICLEIDPIKKIDFNTTKIRIIFSLVIAAFFAIAWIHREDYKDEYHYWKSAADGSPHSSAALRGLASYYQINGQKDKAEKMYIECLKLNPDILEVRNNLGRIYMDNGNDSLAEILFLEEIDINPMTSMAYYNLGHIRFGQGKFAEAETMMRKSLAIDSTDETVESDLAACLAMQGKYEEAVKMCISVLNKYPTYEYPLTYLRKIFALWNDEAKVNYYKGVLSKKGITL